jgi:hypothetical protein
MSEDESGNEEAVIGATYINSGVGADSKTVIIDAVSDDGDLIEVVVPKMNVGDISDGFHTFDELYRHRSVIFLVLMAEYPELSWYSEKHHDGTMFDGMFIAGMSLPTGQITYHFEREFWETFERSGLDKLTNAPEFDGHNSHDVLDRLLSWQGLGKSQS